MPKIIIPDTSCLIFLDKIGEIQILKELYSRVVTTNEITKECITKLGEVDFRISEKIVKEIIKLSGE